MKNVMYYLNGALIILVVLLFYRVNKIEERVQHAFKLFSTVTTSNIFANTGNERSIPIDEAHYYYLDSINHKISTTHSNPFILRKLVNLQYNLKTGEYKTTKNYSYNENFHEFRFWFFNSETKQWSEEKRSPNSNKPIQMNPTRDGDSLKILLVGEDPKTTKDIRDRN
jgi:hypothetical protein